MPGALHNNDVKLVHQIFHNSTKKIQSCAIIFGRKNIAQIGKTLYRPFAAQVYISTYAKCDKRKPTAFKCSSAEAWEDNKYHEVAAIPREETAGWEQRRREVREQETSATSLFKMCKIRVKSDRSNIYRIPF